MSLRTIDFWYIEEIPVTYTNFTMEIAVYSPHFNDFILRKKMYRYKDIYQLAIF